MKASRNHRHGEQKPEKKQKKKQKEKSMNMNKKNKDENKDDGKVRKKRRSKTRRKRRKRRRRKKRRKSINVIFRAIFSTWMGPGASFSPASLLDVFLRSPGRGRGRREEAMRIVVHSLQKESSRTATPKRINRSRPQHTTI